MCEQQRRRWIWTITRTHKAVEARKSSRTMAKTSGSKSPYAGIVVVIDSWPTLHTTLYVLSLLSSEHRQPAINPRATREASSSSSMHQKAAHFAASSSLESSSCSILTNSCPSFTRSILPASRRFCWLRIIPDSKAGRKNNGSFWPVKKRRHACNEGQSWRASFRQSAWISARENALSDDCLWCRGEIQWFRREITRFRVLERRFALLASLRYLSDTGRSKRKNTSRDKHYEQGVRSAHLCCSDW